MNQWCSPKLSFLETIVIFSKSFYFWNYDLLLRWLLCCCSGGWTIVAYCRLQKRKEKTKNRLPNFSFSNVKGKTKTIKVTTPPSIQSVQRSHNDFLRPMKHDLAASDEVATWKELARICFHSSFYDTLGQTEPWVYLTAFPHPICLNALPGYLYECKKVLISWSKLTKTITCLQCSGDFSRVVGE